MSKINLDGVIYDTDDIPELTAEELDQIMGEVEKVDQGTEKLMKYLELVERSDRPLEHNPRFKGFGNGSEISREGGAVC